MIGIGILGSTRGSSMLPIITAIAQKKLAAHINIVISNKADAPILARAAEYNIPTVCVEPQHLTTTLRAHQVDLVVLIGYMRILSAEFVADWRDRIINVHPSLLPAFAGGMDLDVHRAVLASGVGETGCTVHIVTEAVDAGPILVQKKCLVTADDTPETLKMKVQALEGEALVEAIARF